GLARALDAQLPVAELVVAVGRELDRIERMFLPSGSKVLGDAAEGDALVDMVTAMLGHDLLDVLPGDEGERRALARALVRDVVIDGATAEDAVKLRLSRAERASGRTTAAVALTPAPLPDIGETEVNSLSLRGEGRGEGDVIVARLAPAREHAANLAAAP